MNDKTYVMKKLDFTEYEFDRLMKQPRIPHEAYGTEDQKFSYIIAPLKGMMSIIRMVQKFMISPIWKKWLLSIID